jgi:hypothetical protein
MIYEVQTPDGRIIEVEGKPGQEDIAIQLVKDYLDKEKTEDKKKQASKVFDDSFFDYEKGLKNNKIRALLGIAEGRDQSGREIEKENTLKKYVGSQGFIYDTKGNLALTPEGQRSLFEQGMYDEEDLTEKNVVIDERGFSVGDFADISGLAGPIFGAIAALSPHVRGVKLLQMLVRNERLARTVASGLGTAGGKAVEEEFETREGLQTQTEEEQNRLLRNEFYFGAGAQAIGEAAGVAYGAFFGAKAPQAAMRDGWIVANGYAMDDVLRLDARLGKPATESQIKKAVANGEIAKLDSKGAVSQAFLQRAIPGRMQGIGETIAGKAGREKSLINYNMDMLARLQQKLTDKEAAFKRASEIGDLNLAPAQVRAAKQEYKEAQNDIARYLNKMMQDLSSETGGFGPIMEAMDSAKLGASVQNTLKQAYDDTIEHHKEIYDMIDDKIARMESAPILEQFKARIAADLTKVADRIDNRLTKLDPLLKYNEDDVGLAIIQGLSREIRAGAYSGGATLSQLRKIEEALKNVKAVQGLKGRGSAGQFYDEVLDDVSDILTKGDEKLQILMGRYSRQLSDNDKLVMKQVIKELREEQTAYRAAIEPFNNAKVQRLKTQAQGQGIDPEDVYREIVKGGRATDLNNILDALKRSSPGAIDESGKFVADITGEQTANRLRAELTRRLFKDAVDTATDPVTGIISPVKYRNNIMKYNETLRPLLGENYEKTVRTLEQFVKYSPKMKPEEILQAANKIKSGADGLSPSFSQFIEGLEAQAKASDDFLSLEKSSFMRNVENATPETIVKTIFRPNSAREINQLKGIIDEEAFFNVQEAALEDLIRKGMTPGANDLTEIFKPQIFERALQSYGPETLEAMFGKELAMSLKGFGKAMSTTVAGAQKTGAGSIVAGTLAAGFFNLNLLPTVVALTVYKTIFAQPGIVSLLSKTDKGSIAKVFSAFSKALRIAGVSEAMEGSDIVREEVAREVDKTGILDQVRQQAPDDADISSFINQIPGRPSQSNLNVPDVQPIASATAPVSRSLLGGSPANEDIAARQFARQQPNIDEEISRLMRLS